MSGFNYNSITDIIETTGSLNVQTFGVTGSLLGTASWSETASYINISGSGVTVNWSGSILQLTASALPTGGFTNQVLTKQSLTDQDANWDNVAIPASGSTTGLIPTYYDADQGKVVYYDAPLVYFTTGFSGSSAGAIGGTAGTPYRIEYTGKDTFVVIGDMKYWGTSTIDDVVVLDTQGNIITTGSYTNFATPPAQSPGQTKVVESQPTNFYAAAQNINPFFPVTVAGAAINRWNTTTWEQDTSFATNVNANAVDNALVLDVNNSGEIVGVSTVGTVANYRHIYKLNADGTLNTSFSSSFATAQTFAVSELRDTTVLSNGYVLFTINASNRTITYDGVSICSAFTGGIWILINEFGSYIAHGRTETGARKINAVRRDPVDGTKFVIGGEFTQMNYFNRSGAVATINQGIQRITSTGVYDTTWNTGNVGGIVAERTKIRWIEPYYYLVGASYNGISTPGAGVYRIDQNGYLDSSWSLESYAGVRVRDVAAMSNGSLVGVGSDTDTMFPKIAKWSAQGDLNITPTVPTVTNKSLTSFTNGLQVTGSLSITGSIQFPSNPTATNVVYSTIPVVLTADSFDPSTTSPWNTTAVPLGATFFDEAGGVTYLKASQPNGWINY